MQAEIDPNPPSDHARHSLVRSLFNFFNAGAYPAKTVTYRIYILPYFHSEVNSYLPRMPQKGEKERGITAPKGPWRQGMPPKARRGQTIAKLFCRASCPPVRFRFPSKCGLPRSKDRFDPVCRASDRSLKQSTPLQNTDWPRFLIRSSAFVHP